MSTDKNSTFLSRILRMPARLLRSWWTVLPLQKMISVATAGCFLFSFVAAPPAHALIEAGRETRQFNTLLNNFVLPSTLGRVTGLQDFGSGNVVVNIQDLHCHPEVQRNIARILTLLDKKYKLGNVYVEGAVGTLDTSWLSDMKDAGFKNAMIEALVDQGKLTGTEYFSIREGRPDVLRGIEDEAAYRTNFVRLSRILAKQEEFEQQLALMKGDLELVKARYFNLGNRRFEKLIARYRSSQMEGTRYYRLLEKYAQKLNDDVARQQDVSAIDLQQYKNMQEYIELADRGKKIRYRQVARQLQELLQALKAKLPYSAYTALVKRTENFTQLDVMYGSLGKIAAEYHLDLGRNYPQLKAFLDYQEQAGRINPVQMLQEERRLVTEIRTGLSTDINEREISFLTGFFAYFEDFLLNRLTANDYDYFTRHFDQFKLLWTKYIDADRMFAMEEDFALLTQFYGTNVERNQFFIRNIMGDDGGRTAPAVTGTADAAGTLEKASEITVVVTGGFHTDGLQKILDGRGISHVTIMPNVTQDSALSTKIYTELAKEQARVQQQAYALNLLTQYVDDLRKNKALDRKQIEKLPVVFKALIDALVTISNENDKSVEANFKKLVEIFGKGRKIDLVQQGDAWRILFTDEAGADTVVMEYKDDKVTIVSPSQEEDEQEKEKVEPGSLLTRPSNYEKGERFFRETAPGRVIFRILNGINRKVAEKELTYKRATELFYTPFIKLSDMPLHVLDILTEIATQRSATRTDVLRLGGAAFIAGATGAMFFLALHTPFLVLAGSVYLSYGTTHMLYNLVVPWAPLVVNDDSFKKQVKVSDPVLRQQGISSLTFLGPADIGGSKEKYFYVDNKNQLWIFKANMYELMYPYRPLAAVTYYDFVKLYERTRMETFLHDKKVSYYKMYDFVEHAVEKIPVQVHEMALRGKHGTLEKVLFGGPADTIPWALYSKEQVHDTYNKLVLHNAKDLGHKASDLSETAVKQILKEMVIDWLFSNYDSIHENMLVDKEGNIVGIDKEQSFKFFGKDRLDLSYMPNGTDRLPFFYSVVALLAEQNKLSIDSIEEVLSTIESIDDAVLANLLTPLAEQYAKIQPDAAVAKHFFAELVRDDAQDGQMTADEFINMFIERKHHLRKDFADFFADVAKTVAEENKRLINGYNIETSLFDSILKAYEAGDDITSMLKDMTESYKNKLMEKKLSPMEQHALQEKYVNLVNRLTDQYRDKDRKALFTLLAGWMDRKVIKESSDYHRIWLPRDAGYLQTLDIAFTHRYAGEIPGNAGSSTFYVSRSMNRYNYESTRERLRDVVVKLNAEIEKENREGGVAAERDPLKSLELYKGTYAVFKKLYYNDELFRRSIMKLEEDFRSAYLEKLLKGEKLMFADMGIVGTLPLLLWSLAAKALEENGLDWYDAKKKELKVRMALVDTRNVYAGTDEFLQFRLNELFTDNEIALLKETYGGKTIDQMSQRMGEAIYDNLEHHPVAYDEMGERIIFTDPATQLEVYYTKLLAILSAIEYSELHEKGLQYVKPPQFFPFQRLFVNSRYTLLRNMNRYLRNNSPADMRDNKANIENSATEKWSYEFGSDVYRARIVPVDGLLKGYNVLWQARIGESYDAQPVIFVDKMLNDDNKAEDRRTVILHAMNSIRKWEFFRKLSSDSTKEEMQEMMMGKDDDAFIKLTKELILSRIKNTPEYDAGSVAASYKELLKKNNLEESKDLLSLRALYFNEGYEDVETAGRPVMTLEGTRQAYIAQHRVARYLYQKDFFGVTRALVSAWVSVAPGPLGAPRAELERFAAALAEKLRGDATLYDALIDGHRPAGMSIEEWQKSAARRNLAAGLASIETLVTTMLPDTGWTNLSDDDIARISAAIVRAHRRFNAAVIYKKASILLKSFARLDPVTGLAKAVAYMSMTLKGREIDYRDLVLRMLFIEDKLYNSTEEERLVAIRSLGKIYATLARQGKSVDITKLVSMSTTESISVMQTVEETLVKFYLDILSYGMKKQFDRNIAAMLKSRTRAEQVLGIKVLGGVYAGQVQQGNEINATLIEDMLQDSYGAVRETAVKVLADVYVSLMPVRNVDPSLLENMLNDSDPKVVRATLEALNKIYAAATRGNMKIDTSRMKQIFRDAPIYQNRTSVEVLGGILISMVRQGEQISVSDIERMIDESDFRVQITEIEQLGKVYADMIRNGIPVNDSFLKRKLNDDIRAIRMAAVQSLGELYAARVAATKSAVDTSLIERALQQDDEFMRKDALNALGTVYAEMLRQDIKTDTTLIEHALNDEKPNVQIAAVQALAKIYIEMLKQGKEVDLTLILNKLKHNLSFIKEETIIVLGGLNAEMARQNRDNIDLTPIEEFLSDPNSSLREKAVRALSEIDWEMEHNGRASDVTRLENMLHNPDTTVRQAIIETLGVIYAERIRRKHKVNITNIEEMLADPNTWVQKQALGTLEMLYAVMQEQGESIDWSSADATRENIAKIAAITADEINRAGPEIAVNENYSKYALWRDNSLPFSTDLVKDYLESKDYRRYIEPLKIKSMEIIEKGFDYDNKESNAYAFAGLRAKGIKLRFDEFMQRLNTLANFDREHPGYFASLFKKTKGFKPFKISSTEITLMDMSIVDTKVFDNNLSELIDIKKRFDSFESIAEQNNLSIHNIYYEFRKAQWNEKDRNEDKSFFVDLSISEDEMKQEMLKDKRELYRTIFMMANKQSGNVNEAIANDGLRLMHDAVISYGLLDNGLMDAMQSEDTEMRIYAFKTYYQDYVKHFLGLLGSNVNTVRKLREAIKETSKEVYKEINKVETIKSAGIDTYTIVPAGFDSVFRGRAGILTCAFDIDKGVPFARPMHEDTIYYLVYKENKLKGYISLMQTVTPSGEKVLLAYTISAPSLNNEELLTNLFIALSGVARELGAIGIALPPNEMQKIRNTETTLLQRSFMFSDLVIGQMDLYKNAKDIELKPLHPDTWKLFTQKYGLDEYNSIDMSSKFKLLPVHENAQNSGTGAKGNDSSGESKSVAASVFGEKHAAAAPFWEWVFSVPVLNLLVRPVWQLAHPATAEKIGSSKYTDAAIVGATLALTAGLASGLWYFIAPAVVAWSLASGFGFAAAHLWASDRRTADANGRKQLSEKQHLTVVGSILSLATILPLAGYSAVAAFPLSLAGLALTLGVGIVLNSIFHRLHYTQIYSPGRGPAASVLSDLFAALSGQEKELLSLYRMKLSQLSRMDRMKRSELAEDIFALITEDSETLDFQKAVIALVMGTRDPSFTRMFVEISYDRVLKSPQARRNDREKALYRILELANPDDIEEWLRDVDNVFLPLADLEQFVNGMEGIPENEIRRDMLPLVEKYSFKRNNDGKLYFDVDFLSYVRYISREEQREYLIEIYTKAMYERMLAKNVMTILIRQDRKFILTDLFLNMLKGEASGRLSAMDDFFRSTIIALAAEGIKSTRRSGGDKRYTRLIDSLISAYGRTENSFARGEIITTLKEIPPSNEDTANWQKLEPFLKGIIEHHNTEITERLKNAPGMYSKGYYVMISEIIQVMNIIVNMTRGKEEKRAVDLLIGIAGNSSYETDIRSAAMTVLSSLVSRGNEKAIKYLLGSLGADESVYNALINGDFLDIIALLKMSAEKNERLGYLALQVFTGESDRRGRRKKFIESLLSNKQVDDRFRLYAFMLYTSRYLISDGKVDAASYWKNAAALGSVAERFVANSVSGRGEGNDAKIRNLFESVPLQNEEAEVYSMAVLLTMMRMPEFSAAADAPAFAAITQRILKTQIYAHSSNSNSDFRLGGYDDLRSNTPATSFLGTITHELMHNILFFKYRYFARDFASTAMHEMIANTAMVAFIEKYEPSMDVLASILENLGIAEIEQNDNYFVEEHDSAMQLLVLKNNGYRIDTDLLSRELHLIGNYGNAEKLSFKELMFVLEEELRGQRRTIASLVRQKRAEPEKADARQATVDEMVAAQVGEMGRDQLVRDINVVRGIGGRSEASGSIIMKYLKNNFGLLSHPYAVIKYLMNARGYDKIIENMPEWKGKAAYYYSRDPKQLDAVIEKLTRDGYLPINSVFITVRENDWERGQPNYRVTVDGRDVEVYVGSGKEAGSKVLLPVVHIKPVPGKDVASDGKFYADAAAAVIRDLADSRKLETEAAKNDIGGTITPRLIGFSPAVIVTDDTAFADMAQSEVIRDNPGVFMDTAFTVLDGKKKMPGDLSRLADALIPQEELPAMTPDDLIARVTAAARKKKAEQQVRSRYLIMSLDMLDRPLTDEEWDSLRDIMKTMEGENIRLRKWVKQLKGDAQFREAQKRIAALRKAGVQVHGDYQVAANGDAAKQKEAIVRLLKDTGFAGMEIDLSAVTWQPDEVLSWLADIRRNAPDATITVVLPQSLDQKETVKALADEAIIVVEDREIETGDSANSRDIRSAGKGVRLVFSGGQTDKPLQAFIRSLEAPLIEISLIDAARIGNEWFNGANDEQQIALLQKLGRIMPQIIKQNIATLKSLIEETPDMVYESVLKYPVKDVPDMSVWQEQLSKLYEDPRFAAVRASAANGTALPAVDAAFVDAAADLKIEGAGGLKIEQLVREYRAAEKDSPAQQRTAAMLALLLQGLSERTLVKAIQEAKKDPGFTDALQEKLFGRLLLQEALAGRMPDGPVAYIDALAEKAPSKDTDAAKPAGIGANLDRIMEMQDVDKSLSVNAAVRQLEAVRAASAKPKEKEEAVSELLRILYAYADRKYISAIEQQKQMQQQSIRAMLGAA